MVAAVAAAAGWWGWKWYRMRIDPRGMAKNLPELNLKKYDFDNLRKRKGQAGKLEILGNIKAVEDRRVGNDLKPFLTKEFRFQSEGKWISGMINYNPERNSLSKVIIMIRGYAEAAGYYPGSGTWKVADELAKAGFTTISIDFLGYGNSDKESDDVLEARFQKVNQIVDLIESVKALPWVDKDRIGIWAHSNGGQIALSVLEVTGQKYPTVLWAPMTQNFPDSVLSTNEPDSPIVGIMTEFQKHYDARRYAFENYYDWIKAPVLIQQGTDDVWCKVEWQQNVARAINGELVVYEGADHNMGGKKGEIWKEAVRRDGEFYGSYL